jgi:hypothetical protein
MIFQLLLSFCSIPFVFQDPGKVEEFSRLVQEAGEVGDVKAEQKALQKYLEDAVLAYIARAERRLLEDNLQLEEWVENFKRIWSETYSTPFAKNYDRYLQRLNERARETRQNIIFKDFPKVNAAHLHCLNGESADWPGTRENAELLAEALLKSGDLYYYAFALNIVGNLYHPSYYKDGADSEKALSSYEKALAARNQLGLVQDSFYKTLKLTIKQLKPMVGEHEAEVEAEVKKEARETIPFIEGQGAIASETKYSFEDKPGKVQHASELADYEQFTWKRGVVPAPGQSVALQGFEPPVILERINAVKYRFVSGKESSKEFKLAAKPNRVSVMRLHADGELRPATFEICTGEQQTVYQGIEMNLEPTATTGSYFYRSITTLEATSSLGKIIIYDTNSDGVFGYDEMKLDWCEGLLANEWFYRPDAITIGGQKHSQPFSRFVFDKKNKWYELQLSSFSDPTRVYLRPVAPKLGALKFEDKGIKKLKAVSVLLVSESVATKGLVVDLMAMPKKIMLPIGRYKFVQARYASKDGSEVLVLPDSVKPLIIEVDDIESSVAELTLGGSFDLSAKMSKDGQKLVVDGLSLHVVGASGERYIRCIGAPLFGVEVNVRGAKGATLKKPTSNEAATTWNQLWYPMSAEVQLPTASGETTVELTLKKHPWFGALKTEIKL